LALDMLGGVAMSSSSWRWKSPGAAAWIFSAAAVTWVDLALVHLLERHGARTERHHLLRRGAARVLLQWSAWICFTL